MVCSAGHNGKRAEWLYRANGHFRTITAHKLEVMRLCRLCGIPVQGWLHDLTKYLPVEFCTGVRYYQGTRSPNAAEREQKGFSEAWLHHKGRNKHHFEYWIDVPGKYGALFTAAPMPTRYIVEMFCDRVAACKVYQGEAYTDSSPLEYFRRRDMRGLMHQDTAVMLETMLYELAQRGEDETLAWIREAIVLPRFSQGECARF